MKFSCNHIFAFALLLITEETFKKYIRSRRERESLFYEDISSDLKQAEGQKFKELKQTYLLNVP